jgi:poly-gamma-glutamate synthesis protein (capsule biosynthesis protein)
MMSEIRIVVAGQALMERVGHGATAQRMAALRPVLAGADLAVCNLEVAIRTAAPAWPTKEAVLHSAPPEILDQLHDLGFTAVTLANNHAGDLGPAALLAAIDEIERRGLAHAGAGPDAEAAALPARVGPVALLAVSAGPRPLPGRALGARPGRPARPGVNGLAVRRALVADPAGFAALSRLIERGGQADRLSRESLAGRAAAGIEQGVLDLYGLRVEAGAAPGEHSVPDATDRARLIDAVETAAAGGGLPTVSVHYHDWEPDWSVPPPWLRELARDCVDAGAAVVVGHGPPVTAGIEVYRNRLIAYGLGNLVFHTGRVKGYPQPEVWGGFLLDIGLRPDGALRYARLHPVGLDRGAPETFGFPHPAGPDEAHRILAQVDDLSAPFGVRVHPDDGATGILTWDG